MSNPNDPAYPPGRQELGYQYDPSKSTSVAQTYIVPQGGMTIRQRFVMAAMQGLCASEKWMGGDDVTQIELERGIAIHAVRIADATLAEEARTRSLA